MKELVLRGTERTITLKADPIEKLLTIQEDLEGEIETACLSFDEAYEAFNLIIDSIKLPTAM